ncbi:hypothetical protein [Agrococcus sp. ARC_14]|uniref:hypothetical protein n=1 Tax=Agrococcus sp. ARC_14 TaxID=2919927 RepID=UPI001F058F81|nr:hypothetical protein [Agrococcus sp. ARC_14]MCH1881506.1 hypothetical protein [Agrococcus sp. ARC_14]
MFRAAAMVGAAQLVWVFAMGLIAGGQFLEDEWPDWDPLVAWPVLAIPAWVSILISAVGAVGAVGTAIERPRPQELPVIVSDIAIAIIVLGVIPVGLARVYSDPTGLPAPAFGPDAHFGWHWLAALTLVVTLAAFAVRLVRERRASRTA